MRFQDNSIQVTASEMCVKRSKAQIAKHRQEESKNLLARVNDRRLENNVPVHSLLEAAKVVRRCIFEAAIIRWASIRH